MPPARLRVALASPPTVWSPWRLGRGVAGADGSTTLVITAAAAAAIDDGASADAKGAEADVEISAEGRSVGLVAPSESLLASLPDDVPAGAVFCVVGAAGSVLYLAADSIDAALEWVARLAPADIVARQRDLLAHADATIRDLTNSLRELHAWKVEHVCAEMPVAPTPPRTPAPVPEPAPAPTFAPPTPDPPAQSERLREALAEAIQLERQLARAMATNAELEEQTERLCNHVADANQRAAAQRDADAARLATLTATIRELDAAVVGLNEENAELASALRASEDRVAKLERAVRMLTADRHGG
ncbi:uncharacterized protein AMSG_03941 [Thecamonas trahens ATCC 50062]|uniref:Uncharacterized protein n=1 Tax=Thecamonas trahens ATCC 50062 TaxID=461836 RepID=A0A0L0D687_THETB|nr:hypothetical protein AMSG_03941 [Thecamonas trahens ATCC 50062]KNC47710.1 hypothetical protein AMSG_03941 [Thecamonas trahens ATCC 50062]|eukprot:XP_013759192.1 hypothetical protein AMSG_03941 [Thecamonas trahens ATCC 50062]